MYRLILATVLSGYINALSTEKRKQRFSYLIRISSTGLVFDFIRKLMNTSETMSSDSIHLLVVNTGC